MGQVGSGSGSGRAGNLWRAVLSGCSRVEPLQPMGPTVQRRCLRHPAASRGPGIAQVPGSSRAAGTEPIQRDRDAGQGGNPRGSPALPKTETSRAHPHRHQVCGVGRARRPSTQNLGNTEGACFFKETSANISSLVHKSSIFLGFPYWIVLSETEMSTEKTAVSTEH